MRRVPVAAASLRFRARPAGVAKGATRDPRAGRDQALPGRVTIILGGSAVPGLALISLLEDRAREPLVARKGRCGAEGRGRMVPCCRPLCEIRSAAWVLRPWASTGGWRPRPRPGGASGSAPGRQPSAMKKQWHGIRRVPRAGPQASRATDRSGRPRRHPGRRAFRCLPPGRGCGCLRRQRGRHRWNELHHPAACRQRAHPPGQD